MMRSWAPYSVFALLALVQPAESQVTGEAPLEVLHGFTLIDGTGAPPIEDAAISIRGNSIVTVGSRRELLSGPSAPRNAIVINLGGGFVVPGLVDAHVHLASSPDRAHAEAVLSRLLYSGVTAVRDMAGDARALASLARDSRLGEIGAPDVYFSALMAGPSFLSDPRPHAAAAGETPGDVPWIQAVTADTDLVTAVARARGTYATGVKIYANLEPALVAGITEEAHRQGMQVWAHSMVYPTRPIDVVRSGVDVISHVCEIAWEAMADAPTEYDHDMRPRYEAFSAESPVFDALFAEMSSRGTVLDATLATYARADNDPLDPLSDHCEVDFARALVQRALNEGIPIAAGTDFTNPPESPFPALFDELRELVGSGGMTPMQAIVAATSNAATAIGVEATHGTLEHGRPVNFVLLRDDPLEDIGNLRSVQAVYKNAERFDRAAYRPSFPSDEVTGDAPSAGGSTPEDLLDGWLDMWRRYDLDAMSELFVNDPALTYFPSDAQGLITGFGAVRAYHEGLGFVSGGFEPEDELWLEDVTISDFGESAVVGGLWYFGSRVDSQAAASGPVTITLARTASGYRISHLHFGNYPPEN